MKKKSKARKPRSRRPPSFYLSGGIKAALDPIGDPKKDSVYIWVGAENGECVGWINHEDLRQFANWARSIADWAEGKRK